MGRLLGHSATGTYWYLLGLFWFLRSLDLQMFRKIRTNHFFVAGESVSLAIGGVIYTIGEIFLMFVQIGEWHMSTSQHVIMSSTFSLFGCLCFLHIFGYLKAAAWGFVEPFLWLVLGVLWYFHPQDNPYFAFGHASIGVLFLIVFMCRSAEILIMMYSNREHHVRVFQKQQSLVKSGNAISLSQRVHSPYTNPMVYAYPFTTLSGFFLMVVGTWDWDMAVHFGQGYANLDISGFSDEQLEMMYMDSEEALLVHVLANLVVCTFLSLLLHHFDRSKYPDRSPQDNWFLLGSQHASNDGRFTEAPLLDRAELEDDQVFDLQQPVSESEADEEV